MYKVCGAILGPIFLAACATTQTPTPAPTHVLKTDQPTIDEQTCVGSQSVYTVDPETGEVIADLGQVGTGFDRVCAQERRQDRILEISVEVLLTALNNPHIDDSEKREIRLQMLTMMRSSNPEDADRARMLFENAGHTELSIHEYFARDFIRNQISILAQDDGKPNYPAIATLLDLREQDQLPQDRRRFPELPPAFLRDEVDIQLIEKGLTTETLTQIYRAGFNQEKIICTEAANPDGSVRTRCATETQAAPGLFIIN